MDAGTPLAAPKWQLADLTLVVRRWPGEEECVVFSPLSGEVHLLNLAALALLEALGHEPQTVQDLSEQLAREAGRSVDGEWSDRLEVALTTLDHAGLIEPASRDCQ